MRVFKSILLASTMLISAMSNATLITVGDISYDDTTNYLTDTVTGTQYTSLDATLGWDYSSLVSATMSGRAWEGWSIATSKESDDLLSALLSGNSACTGTVSYFTFCGLLNTRWSDGFFGQSSNPSNDYWFYLSTYDTPGRTQSDIGFRHD